MAKTGKDCLLTRADGVKVADRRDRTRNLSLRKRCTNHCTTGPHTPHIFGSSGARIEFHRGQLFISLSLFFLLQSEDSENFTVFHVFGNGLRTCAPAKSIVTSQKVTGEVQQTEWELCNYVIITIAAWLKIENWASGVMFDRARWQLTGKEVVSHS